MMEGSIGMKHFSLSVLVSGQQLAQIKAFRVRMCRHVEPYNTLVQQHKEKCNQADPPPSTMLFFSAHR